MHVLFVLFIIIFLCMYVCHLWKRQYTWPVDNVPVLQLSLAHRSVVVSGRAAAAARARQPGLAAHHGDAAAPTTGSYIAVNIIFAQSSSMIGMKYIDM